jgi:hypothetical protein
MTSRREKFINLAEKRVNRLINEIRLIGNLSNSANYEYSDEDVSKIFRTLDSALKESRSKFKNGHAKDAAKFKL